MSSRRYRVVVHAPAPEGADTIDRLRAAAVANGLEVAELRIENAPDGARVFHLETELEALSAYDARDVSGLILLADTFARAEIAVERQMIMIAAERAS